MTSCQYFHICGKLRQYECEHDGNMPVDSDFPICKEAYRLSLETAASEMEEWDRNADFREFQENSRLAEIMSWEATI